MNEAAIVALATVAAALIAGTVALVTHRMSRLAKVERRMDALDGRNKRLWMYCRQLIDHIYRGLGPPPPPWPDELLDKDE